MSVSKYDSGTKSSITNNCFIVLPSTPSVTPPASATSARVRCVSRVSAAMM